MNKKTNLSEYEHRFTELNFTDWNVKRVFDSCDGVFANNIDSYLS